MQAVMLTHQSCLSLLLKLSAQIMLPAEQLSQNSCR